MNRHLLLAWTLVVTLPGRFLSTNASATAGFAEWSVPTPGGNYICHTDPYIGRFSVWLADDCQSEHVYASRLVRWRYYDRVVAGEAERGYFLFDEGTKAIDWFRTEHDLDGALEKTVRVELSRWLTPGDGYEEAWFSPLTWQLCRRKLAPKSGGLPGPAVGRLLQMPEMLPFNPPVGRCRELLDAELPRYFLTSVKQSCLKWPEDRHELEKRNDGSSGSDSDASQAEFIKAMDELCAERERSVRGGGK